MKAFALLAIVLIAGGCAKAERLFPLREGAQWSYQVKNGMADFVDTIKVTRRLPVAGVSGYELTGSMGTSRLAWKDGLLYATVLPGMRLRPPLPILNSDGRKATLKWEGTVFAVGKASKATATLVQGPEDYMKRGTKVKTTKTLLTLSLPDRDVEISTWYAANVGPLSQVQRSKSGGAERFDVGLTYLSGP